MFDRLRVACFVVNQPNHQFNLLEALHLLASLVAPKPTLMEDTDEVES